MTPQMQAFLVWLLWVAVIGIVFGIAVRGSSSSSPPAPERVDRMRLLMLLVLLVLAGFGLGLTLPRAPYPKAAEVPDRVVFVMGKQFAFALSEDPITNEEEYEEAIAYGSGVEVRRGELIEFRVSSLDVNHGFSLYSPDHRLIAQVQAMPGYVNRLRTRFSEPGDYRILCLEYCGNSHHAMRGVVSVR